MKQIIENKGLDKKREFTPVTWCGTESKIGLALITEMAYDNGAEFTVTERNAGRLIKAVAAMKVSGFKFTKSVISDLVAGEAFDITSKYRKVPGFKALDSVLNDIFEDVGGVDLTKAVR